MRLSLTLVILVGFLTAACAQEDRVKQEMKKLQGTWKVVDYHSANEELAKTLKEKGKFVFTGDKMKLMVGGESFGETRFQIDPSKDPKHFDVIQEDEKKEKRVVLGIYNLEVDQQVERLLIRTYDDIKSRPDDFVFKDGDKGGLAVLERDKKK